MTVYEIPLTAAPQTFQVALAGKTYQLTLKWCDAPSGGWILDIADSASNPLVCGIPLVTGVDLLAQYPDLSFGGSLYVQTDGDPLAVPTFTNLGSTAHLYFVAP